MTEREVLKLALECAERCESIDGMYSWADTITAIKEALREHAMYEVQRLGQEIQPEQEPVAVVVQVQHPAAVALKLKADVPVGATLYTTPPQRTWVELTDEDKQIAFDDTQEGGGFWEFADAIEAKLKEKNT